MADKPDLNTTTLLAFEAGEREGWRRGAEAMREAAAKWIAVRSSACIAASNQHPAGSVEHESAYFAGMEASHNAKMIRSLPLPEYRDNG